MTKVNEKDSVFAARDADWSVIDALLGGTPAMRGAGKTLLPQQPRESSEDYQYRLATSTLFPAFARTLAVMAGKPFAKELTISEDTPGGVAALLPDIDGAGASLHVFAAMCFLELVGYGLSGILVDYTRADSQQPRTLAQERSAGMRPYWVHYNHSQILGVRYEATTQGRRMTQVRLLESVEEPSGDFGTAEVEQVRVLSPGSWQVYRRVDGANGDWALYAEGVTSIPDIPFVLVQAGNTGGVHLPLKDLAYLNVKHWQHQSDQDESARFCRKRLLVFTGISSGDELVIASDVAINLPQGADAKILQGSAEAIKIGREELDALEEQMVRTGAELMIAQPGQRTATEANNDAEANRSELQNLIERYEDALDQALHFTAAWLGVEQVGAVALYKDFGSATLSDASAQLIAQIVGDGWITKLTGIKEMQRRAILSPDIDAAIELASAEEQPPALGDGGGM